MMSSPLFCLQHFANFIGLWLQDINDVVNFIFKKSSNNRTFTLYLVMSWGLNTKIFGSNRFHDYVMRMNLRDFKIVNKSSPFFSFTKV